METFGIREQQLKLKTLLPEILRQFFAAYNSFFKQIEVNGLSVPDVKSYRCAADKIILPLQALYKRQQQALLFRQYLRVHGD